MRCMHAATESNIYETLIYFALVTVYDVIMSSVENLYVKGNSNLVATFQILE